MDSKVKVGQIIKTYGLKGFLKCRFFDDNPLYYKKLLLEGKLPLYRQDRWVTLKVKDSFVRENFLYVCFQDYADINLAQDWRGYFFYLEKQDLPALSNEQYYFYDLIHLDIVVQTSHKELEKVAVVNDVLYYGDRVFLEVKTIVPEHCDEQEQKKSLFCLPFQEFIFGDVDLNNKTIYLKDKAFLQ